MPERILCPDSACTAPAQIVDRWASETPTVDMLAIQPAARTPVASAASA